MTARNPNAKAGKHGGEEREAMTDEELYESVRLKWQNAWSDLPELVRKTFVAFAAATRTETARTCAKLAHDQEYAALRMLDEKRQGEILELKRQLADAMKLEREACASVAMSAAHSAGLSMLGQVRIAEAIRARKP